MIEREEFMDHFVRLPRPNLHQSWAELDLMLEEDVALTGRCYAWVVGDEVLRLNPIDVTLDENGNPRCGGLEVICGEKQDHAQG